MADIFIHPTVSSSPRALTVLQMATGMVPVFSGRTARLVRARHWADQQMPRGPLSTAQLRRMQGLQPSPSPDWPGPGAA